MDRFVSWLDLPSRSRRDGDARIRDPRGHDLDELRALLRLAQRDDDLSFTIGNPNLGGTPIGVSFTDNLPAGLVVADPNNLTDDCGGSVTAGPGTSSVTLSSGSLDPTAVGKILLSDADDGIHGQELWRYRP